MRTVLAAGAVSGGLAVALGAYAAHGLPDELSSEARGWIGTGLDYHMSHALALLAIGLYGRCRSGLSSGLLAAAVGFAAGTLLFSGGLYLRAFGAGFPAALIPVGGAAFLVGWVALFWTALRPERGRS